MRIAEIFRSIQGEGRLTGTDSIFVRTSGCNLRCGYCDTSYASWTPEGEELLVATILGRIDRLRQSEPPVRQTFPARPAFQPDTEAVYGKRDSPIFVDHGFAAVPAKMGTVPPSHIVLTGGEPMLFAELIPLSASLHAQGWHITIETSGTLYLPVACDLMSISPKLSNSAPPPELDAQWTWRHTRNRHAPEVIRQLITEYDYQLKFVIDQIEDCCEVETYLAELPEIERSRVMLMPQGIDAPSLAEKSAWLEPYCLQRGFHFCPRRQIEWFGAGRGK
jgi:7-carboxy-7-deazaguanine synthase